MVVVFAVFWNLKLTGITLAGEAFCGRQEHIHDSTCQTFRLACTEPEGESHTHGEGCYETLTSCSLAEHIHDVSCYSDLSADLETEDDWEMTLNGLVNLPDLGQNVVQVAQSQLGYRESTRNFQVDGAGIRRGYTRYGEWYGNPYGDWSAMFVSFCLSYGGVMDVPLAGGPETMRLAWEEAGRFQPAIPEPVSPGTLLFVDPDGDGWADSVGVITGLDESGLSVILGDREVSGAEEVFHEVTEARYALDSTEIMGYGLLPEDGYNATPYAPWDYYNVWLDGTCGGLMGYGGSPNQRYSVQEAHSITLPTEWASPVKYNYKLRGWYDVTNNRYYAPGTDVQIYGNTVFYADWVAASYDFGQLNSQVSNTVSTKDFVTVRMFDYSVLFNVQSERVDWNRSTVNSNSHTEVWQLITSGNNPYNGQPTLNYIFRDWDRGDEDISYPVGTNAVNNPTDAGSVYPGLYSKHLANLLFGTDNSFNPQTGSGVIGKQYLGTADHLFHFASDPNDPHYGYYYYDSVYNAASYNQSEERFYVYDYLERTSDSVNNEENGKYSDFLPMNSPYVPVPGKNNVTYSYPGINGEYPHTTHYQYDGRYNTEGSSVNNVGTNYWFGMSIDIDFYLPNAVGSTVGGQSGNRDVYGQEMHFHFDGDDDVWVLVDGQLVLDLGGIHGIEGGDINFSTGVVQVNDVAIANMNDLVSGGVRAGDHVLTIYYLERGASLSNCAMFFNLAPRFTFTIQKEDVLTREVLNGAQFSVYTDEACTVPAKLWPSQEAYRNDKKGENATNVFTVENGVAKMWGFGAGNTYYIKETKPPDDPRFGIASGIIAVTVNNKGAADYHVSVIKDGTASVSPGFTVHGYRIDELSQEAYIVITNAQNWVEDVTSVRARKVWADNIDHSRQTVTVYLTVTDPDGTVRRIREAKLGSFNNWIHLWDNLPKYYADGKTEIRYGVEEAYVPGYYPELGADQATVVTGQGWITTTTLEANKTYLLRSGQRYLSSQSSGSGQISLCWVDEATAKSSRLAQWRAEWVSQYSCYKFVNGDGQYITSHESYRSFYVTRDNVPNQCLNVVPAAAGLRLFAPQSDANYYFKALNNNSWADYTTRESEALIFDFLTWGDIVESVESDTWLFKLTNHPLDSETALSVTKAWDLGHSGTYEDYKHLQVTVKLLANGKDTGRTVTLNVQNNWSETFRGLPYKDTSGKVIVYTVVENWDNFDWIPYYGPIETVPGDPPTYKTTLTNVYRWGTGDILPSTGHFARLGYILCGGLLMLAPLVYGIRLRRKAERGRG